MSLLNYTECEFDSAKLTAAKEEFEALHAKISGRSEGYKSITKPVGDDFSDLIGGGLRELAEKNQDSWQDALMACTHAFGVLGKASTDVDWYEGEIAKLKTRLTSALNAIPVMDQDNFALVRSTRQPFDTKARALWTKFEARCEETEDILKDGPIPRRIRQLSEGGHFGRNTQIGYQTTGSIDFYTIDEDFDPDYVIQQLHHGVVNGRGGSLQALENDPRILELLANMFNRADDARRDGAELSERELAFLERIYGSLGNRAGHEDRGFLRFVDDVDKSEHIDDRMRGDIQRILANGMLVLSSEDVGGGMDRLPEDVRRTAVGPDRIDPMRDGDAPGVEMSSYSSWSDDWQRLSDFLGHSGGGVRGGTEFSTSMLRTGADMLPRSAVDGVPPIESFQNIVDAATRNPEANHVILTGKGFDGNDYPAHANHEHLTPKQMVQDLYTVPWPDGGEAVRGLNRWMNFEPSPEDDGIPEDARDNAMVSFMEMMEDEKFVEAVSRTGANVKGKDDDGNEFEWKNVSAGQLNPELADGLVDLFLRYSDTFGHTEGVGPDNSVETGKHGEVLKFSSDARLAFTELVVGDPEAAGRLYGEVRIMAGMAMEGYVDDVGSDGSLAVSRSGVLTGLVEEAMLREAKSRGDDHNAAVERGNRTKNAVLEMGAAALLDAKVPNTVSVGLKLFVQDAWTEQEIDGAHTHVPVRNSESEKSEMTSIALQALVKQDPALLDRIDAEFPGVVAGTGSGRHIPPDPKDWEHEDGGGIAFGVLEMVADEPWPGGDRTAGDSVDAFLGAFNSQRENWQDKGGS